MIISAGTIVSSLCSERLNARLGTGGVTAVSVLLTAAALFGFSTCTRFWQLCVWAVPYGLGAGSVDAALNAYVSLHYKSRHMSWLHCMWGVGASAGPVIMGRALAGGSWQGGYRIISLIQFGLTAVLLLSLPLWKRPEKTPEGADYTPEHRTLPQLLRMPGVPQVLLCFFCYCALESTAGMWAASYCTLVRGIDAGTAAGWASTFYLGITIGRGVCGFLTIKINDQNMIRLGQVLIALGVVLVLLPAGQGVLFAGLVTIGLGCAPVYPQHHPRDPHQFRPGGQPGHDRHPDGLCLRGQLPDAAAVRPAGPVCDAGAVPLVPGRAAGFDVRHGRKPAPPHPRKAPRRGNRPVTPSPPRAARQAGEKTNNSKTGAAPPRPAKTGCGGAALSALCAGAGLSAE